MIRTFCFLILMGTSTEIIAQNDISDLSIDQLSEQNLAALSDIQSQGSFHFHRFDWLDWQSTGIFSDVALNGIQERVKRMGEMTHWLELQSIAGVDTQMISSLLSKFPDISDNKQALILKDREITLRNINRLQFPFLNRYYSEDSSKIPEGSPWLQRVRLIWQNQGFMFRFAIEKDMGEPLTPVNQYSWTITKSWEIRKSQLLLIVGQFRPFFGIGYLHGLRGGRINGVTSSWTEAYDFNIKPIAAISENTNPEGVTIQWKKGHWTVGGFFSIRKFEFTDSIKIDLIEEVVWSARPKISGLQRMDSERSKNYGTEYWSSFNLLYQRRTWALGFMISSESWSYQPILKSKWLTFSGFLRKSYSGGHIQTEWFNNQVGQLGIKTDWIHWFGNLGTLQMKSQAMLAQPNRKELNKLIQWRNATVNEQFIQLIYQMKLGKAYQIYQQIWQDWATQFSENAAGFGFGFQWIGNKTTQMLAEIRWTKALTNIIYQAQWSISQGQRLKTIWRINPSSASIASTIQYTLQPERSPLKIQIQYSGFSVKQGVVPILESDFEFPFRMHIASGAGSRYTVVGKYRFPPYLTLGLLGSVTQKIGSNPWGTGLDGRIGNYLYEVGFSVEIRLKDKSHPTL